MRLHHLVFILAITLISHPAKAQSEQEIKQLLIQQSIAAYPGNCPCPYNAARNGSRCGKRSAYNRGGGYAPLCYPEDVSSDMVERYRKAARLPRPKG